MKLPAIRRLVISEFTEKKHRRSCPHTKWLCYGNQGLEVAVSGVTHLELKDTSIQAKTLANMISSCRALSSFSYMDHRTHGPYEAFVLKPKFFKALQRHAGSIKNLTIRNFLC